MHLGRTRAAPGLEQEGTGVGRGCGGHQGVGHEWRWVTGWRRGSGGHRLVWGRRPRRRAGGNGRRRGGLGHGRGARNKARPNPGPTCKLLTMATAAAMVTKEEEK